MIGALLELLNRLSVWLDAYLRRRRAAKAQRARDELEHDPAGWFGDHFIGVRDDPGADTDPADAGRSDESQQ